MNALDRAFDDWYADRDPLSADSWWNGNHECDDYCACVVKARATALANDSLVIDENAERENAR